MKNLARLKMLLCVVVVLLCLPGPAQAELSFWWGRSPADRLVEQAADARGRAELRLAASLLDEAERQPRAPMGRILRERGLLQLARGDLSEAARLLSQSADRDPASTSRLDQAAVLVQLGRWPDAVMTLKQAIAERGSALRADDVVADSRFSGLSGFEPFETLLNETRAEQAGPLGKILLRIERVETSVTVAARILEQISDAASFFLRLANAMGAAVVTLILLGFMMSAGIQQLGVVRPPWPLITGMVAASTLWHLGVRVGSGGEATGARTIAIALGVVLGPWLLLVAVQGIVRRVRRRRHNDADALAAATLPHTLALVDAVAQLGRRYLAAPDTEKARIALDLAEAKTRLVERLR